MKKFKQLFLGVVIGAVLTGGIAFAATYTANVASFPVYVNGARFQATTGQILEVDGRTYLPVRDMSNALGVAINWNETLRQVEIGTPPAGSQGGQVQQQLVGRWQFQSGRAVYYFLTSENIEFYSNGSVMEFDFEEPGTWSVSGNTLTVVGEWFGTESFTFSVSGNTLTMTDRDGDTIVYRRM